MPPAKRTVTLDVSGSSDEATSVAADIFLPAFPAANAALLFCIAGGGLTRDLFNLGEPRDDSNFAHAMTARGHVVVAVELQGEGSSLATESERMLRAVTELRRKSMGGIRFANLPAIGIGHTESGMVIGYLQGNHNLFAGVALLGFSLVGHPLRLTNEMLLAIRSRGPEASVTELAMMPGHTAQEIGMITSPVFVGASDRDGAGAVPGVVAALGSCPDYTCFVITGATDVLFDAAGIGALYERLNNWLTAVVTGAAMSVPSSTVSR